MEKRTLTVYLLLAIVKKERQIDADLHKLLQIASLTVFEKTPIFQAFGSGDFPRPDGIPANQLILFE